MDLSTLVYMAKHLETETLYLLGATALVLFLIPVFVILALKRFMRGRGLPTVLLNAWAFVARLGMLALGLGLSLGSAYWIWRLAADGPAKTIGTTPEDWLVRIPFFFMFGAPPFFLAAAVVKELLARRYRRRLAAILAEAAQGTSLAVVPVAYPFVTLGWESSADAEYSSRGLNCLPEDLRGLTTHHARYGGVAGVLRGTLAGRETAVYEYTYWDNPQSGRYAFQSEHRLTAAAVRTPLPAERFYGLLPGDWLVKGNGRWVVFETRGALDDTERCRELLRALAALPAA